MSLTGAVPVAQPELKPNETLVQELERLLQAARAGQIVGMAGAYQHQDRIVTYSYASTIGGYALLGGIECLKQRLVLLAVSRD